MKKTKVLILVDWFYPGYKAGGPIQSVRNFIIAMEDSLDICVVCYDHDMGDTEAYPGIQADVWTDYSASTKVYYASALSLSLLKRLQRETAPDYIYLNSMFSLRFTIFPLLLKWWHKTTARLVLAPRGMLHKGALKFKPQKKLFFLWLLRVCGIYKKIIFHATDPQEKKDVLSYFPFPGNVVIASNFPRMIQAQPIPVSKKPGELKCVFISRISPKKNLDYLLSLLQNMPAGIKLTLTIGGDPEDKVYWQECLSLIKALPSNITVRYGGGMENDAVTAFIQQHHLFVLPTLGENFGHAIFESFSAGRPVLISNYTPWQDLEEKKAGWDVQLEDKKAFLAVLIKAAAMSDETFNEWCMGAWQLANRFITETGIRQQYAAIFV